MTEQKRISFSPPDITQAELDEVADALRSGWITTGPKTKEFEREIALFAQAERSATFASATAALECALRAFGIGPGDEVITSAYTYTASLARSSAMWVRLRCSATWRPAPTRWITTP